MTKKDYIKAAKITALVNGRAATMPNSQDRLIVYQQAELVEECFATLFRDDNPNFDETLFRQACKGK